MTIGELQATAGAPHTFGLPSGDANQCALDPITLNDLQPTLIELPTSGLGDLDLQETLANILPCRLQSRYISSNRLIQVLIKDSDAGFNFKPVNLSAGVAPSPGDGLTSIAISIHCDSSFSQSVNVLDIPTYN